MSLINAVKAKLAAQGIHSVLTQFCDIHGVARGKLVPVSQLGDLVHVGRAFRLTFGGPDFHDMAHEVSITAVQLDSLVHCPYARCRSWRVRWLRRWHAAGNLLSASPQAAS